MDCVDTVVIGAGATIISYIFVAFVKPAMKYDDSLDVFGVHGMAGILGAIATGIFAIQGFGVNRLGGAYYGNTAQVMLQLKAVGLTLVYSGVVSFILLKLIDLTIGLRISEALALKWSDVDWLKCAASEPGASRFGPGCGPPSVARLACVSKAANSAAWRGKRR